MRVAVSPETIANNGEHVSRANDEFEILSISSAASTASAGTACSDTKLTSTASLTGASNAGKTPLAFEICADCFQMMEGVLVSANETDLALKPSSPTVHYRKQLSHCSFHETGSSL